MKRAFASRTGLAWLTLLLAAPAARAAPPAEPPPIELVACAPGYPGTTAEAQPSMTAFADALARATGWPARRLSATYLPTEREGRARLAAPGPIVALVP